jgi:hypothetical protein
VESKTSGLVFSAPTPNGVKCAIVRRELSTPSLAAPYGAWLLVHHLDTSCVYASAQHPRPLLSYTRGMEIDCTCAFDLAELER